jgi:hypothetical protein
VVPHEIAKLLQDLLLEKEKEGVGQQYEQHTVASAAENKVFKFSFSDALGIRFIAVCSLGFIGENLAWKRKQYIARGRNQQNEPALANSDSWTPQTETL